MRIALSHLTTQLGPIFIAFSARSSPEGRTKVRSILIPRTFLLPDGRFPAGTAAALHDFRLQSAVTLPENCLPLD
jgi:hypothetical protein